jgi:secretion/DNA translocation related TadE-like protein
MKRLVRTRDEQGAATVLILAIAALAVMVTVAVLALSVAASARAKASAGADAAALAGTGALALGGLADPCVVAANTARENGARLVSCHVKGTTVAVEVVLRTPFFGLPDAHARSRAGIDTDRFPWLR